MTTQSMTTEPIRELVFGKLRMQVYPNKEAAGAAAARDTATAMREAAAGRDSIGVIFATGASQMAMLDALTTIQGVPWEKVLGFHMDEYIGIDPDHPASFRRYLRERLTSRVPMRRFLGVDGNNDAAEECRSYAEALRSAESQLCLLGIGENGHLAFNDPGEADFQDPVDMKVVHLDDTCRNQQLAEGWFPSLNEVPDKALTLTIPALLRAPKLIASVPGPRKAAIVRRTAQETISTACPATILRTHPDATVYLDLDSAAELP
jgi:glucosamine-6-phosphate deaminase